MINLNSIDMKNVIWLMIGLFMVVFNVQAQIPGAKAVLLKKAAAGGKIDVLIDNKLFASFLFAGQQEKPFLYPLKTASGVTVTRSFPLEKRAGERVDHPHHVGLWLNYESVNGLDFWNNSYAIPAERKSKYGWIRNVRVEAVKSGKQQGGLSYAANWEKQDGTVVLKEKTELIFSGNAHMRFIERRTTLRADKDTVFFKDVKDGMIGLRVRTELEMPLDKKEDFTTAGGDLVKASSREMGANGTYLTSEGLKGAAVWGTRANWCVLSAQVEQKKVAVAIIDHPKNPGYPTYWHARDYGLFAANPLGQSVFSKGSIHLNLKLAPGSSITFRYLVVLSEKETLDKDKLDKLAVDFSVR